MAASKKPHFPAPPILNIFSWNFHGFLGLVELIDAKGIGVAQLIWLSDISSKQAKNDFFVFPLKHVPESENGCVLTLSNPGFSRYCNSRVIGLKYFGYLVLFNSSLMNYYHVAMVYSTSFKIEVHLRLLSFLGLVQKGFCNTFSFEWLLEEGNGCWQKYSRLR